MSTEAHEAVEGLVRALNHGSLDDVLEAFTHDAVFTADGGTATGRAQLAQLFDGVLTPPRARMIIRRTELDGNTLDCAVTRRFTMTDGDQAFAHDVEIRCVFTVRDGAVARVVVDPVE